jgi:pimeloyl-ACP methyl ester carboxylesterase
MNGNSTTHLSRSYDLTAKVSRLIQTRTKLAQERFAGRMQKSFAEHISPLLTRPMTPGDLWAGWSRYAMDSAQRAVLFWDALRQRGNAFVEHTRAGLPPVLHFTYETVLDARTFERPVNYALVRVAPPAGVMVDPKRRPYIILDPRAGHGPGIGGFKDDSQVGVALAAGHPVYFVIFFPEPEDGQTIYDVCAAEQKFVHEVRARHPESPRPVIVGNCQGGWAAMMLASASPEDAGPIVINGAPMSYWGGAWREGEGDNPMRYAGGLLGGTWLASLASDLGHGKFDGAWLVQNFENLNPANTFWDKYYHLYATVDTEAPRFLEFERWWGGFYLLNREEIEWITQNLFVGNKLWSGDVHPRHGKGFDLREIKSPIVLFASMGDNITPPQQAFNWIADVYGSTEEIKARGQVIVGLLHQDIGHLGIFVSGKVAKKEHAQIVSVMESIEALPAGLYGMQILENRAADGRVQYEVQFVEHRLEEVAQRLNRFKRADEKPFDAVQAVSEFNQRAYELFAQPFVQAMASEPAAKLGRAFHPLRFQRWAVSDYYNPWLWWLGPMADAVRAQRKAGTGTESTGGVAEANPGFSWLRTVMDAAKGQPAGAGDPGAMLRMMAEANPGFSWLRTVTDAAKGQPGDPGAMVRAMMEANPWVQWLRPLTEVVSRQPGGDADEPARHVERMMSEATSAVLDYYREMRDALSESAFFLTYGNLFSFYLADRRAAEERTPGPAVEADPRHLPFVREALASIEQGGYAEALARIAALIDRDAERIPLAQLELRRDMFQDYAEFLPAIPREQMRRIRGEQDIIVRYEPERARETLPKLLADPADRDRAVTLIKRLLADERARARKLTPEDFARVDAILAVLGAPPRRPLTKVPRTA